MLTPKEIGQLAKDLDTDVFGGQKDLDKKCDGIIRQTHIVEMEKDKNVPAKPVGTGYGALITKQNFAFISTLPFIRFNAPKDTLKGHAEKLEKANEACWKASGARRAWLRATYDAVSIGRGWIECYPVPDRWAGDEFHQGATESDNDYLSRLKGLKLQEFPIVARRVDPRRCWATFDDMEEVDQVVQIRKMRVRDIKKTYGVELDDEDMAELDVIRYADDECQITILGDENPRALWEFKHGMGMNPFVLLEMPILPDNEEGWRWAGSVFDLRHLIPELDGAVSDLRHQTKRQTHSQPVLNLDLEARRQDSPTAKSNAELIEDSPDKPLILDKDEKHSDRFPHGLASPDVLNFLTFGTTLTKENAIRPVLLGILEQGGDSGVRYNTGAQIAQGSFGPAIEYLKPAAEGVTRRILASVTALSKDFSDITDADKVPVIYANGKGHSETLELGPQDVAGWGAPGTIQARIDLAIPINENAEIVTGRLYADKKDGLGAQETALERWAHCENPRAEMQLRRNEMLMDLMMEDVAQIVRARGGQLLAQPSTPPGVLQQQFAALRPEIQQAVAMAAQMQGLQAPGVPEARAEAGRAQTGMSQSPSNTEGTMIRGVRSE